MDKKKVSQSRDEIIEDFFDFEPVTTEYAKDEIKEWYYIDKGEITGSCTEQELLLMYKNGKIKASTEVWKNGMTDWVELQQTDLIDEKSSGKKKTKDKAKQSREIPSAEALNESAVKQATAKEEEPEEDFSWEEAIPRKKTEGKEGVTSQAEEEDPDMSWQEALLEEEEEALPKTRLHRRSVVEKKEEEELGNSLVWILTLVPFLVAGAILLNNLPLFLLLLILHIVICIMDANMVIKAGHMEGKARITAVFLTPVYLIKRSNVLKQSKTPIFVWSGLVFVVLVLTLQLIYTQLKPDTGKGEVATVEDNKEAVVDTGDITVQKFVEHYFTNPSYSLEDQQTGQSLLTITGTMSYQGKSEEAKLIFRVDEDDSVHYSSMSLDGVQQEETVYQELMDAIK